MATAAGRSQTPQTSFFSATLEESDPELAGMVGREFKRQQDEIELIASENIVSRAVLETVGTVLTNKYAEGYPGNRYYGGCQYVDEAEMCASLSRASDPEAWLAGLEQLVLLHAAESGRTDHDNFSGIAVWIG